MRDPGLSGASAADQRLWNSYVYWARLAAGGSVPTDLIVSDPENRILEKEESSLHTILFAAFALEYRLRSVYGALNLDVPRSDGLQQLLNNLQTRTRHAAGLTGAPISFDREWRAVRARLNKLLDLRNLIAHGRRASVTELLESESPPPAARAVDGYNAVIDAIRIINVAIGYESRTGEELDRYYRALQVPELGA